MQICVYRRLPFCHVQMPPVTPMSCLPPWFCDDEHWSKAIEQWMNKPDLVCFYRAGSSCSVIFLPVRPLLGCERLLSGFFSQCFLCACCGYRVTELSLFLSPMAYRCFVQIIFVGKFQSFLRPCKTTFKFFPALF